MDKVLCNSCSKSKNKLVVKKSNLFPINLLMCEACVASKLEPRWAIILCGRQNGSDSVKELILKRKYIGNDITASELLV